MSHTAFVQDGSFCDVQDEPGSGVFKRNEGSCNALTSIGVLGCDEHYTMPKGILEVLGNHVGGKVSMELPPFLVACKDGFILILTLRAGADFMGCAFHIPCERLAVIDKQIEELWSRVSKEMNAEEFLNGTAFKLTGCTPELPSALEGGWSGIFC